MKRLIISTAAGMVFAIAGLAQQTTVETVTVTTVAINDVTVADSIVTDTKSTHSVIDSTAIAVAPLRDNWYVQAGLDMSLQNPYGFSWKHVFPQGKTFGVDVALGRWFTPALGLRGRLNWENGIKLFRNNHAGWLAPFFDYGKNMDRGGYVTVVGDIQLDMQNLFMGYRPGRMWNMQAFFRAGGLYNFGTSKGSPVIGAGIGNTFRVSDRVSLYADVAYQFVSSGHTGNDAATGTGNNSNGFMDISIGAQINLGRSGFRSVADLDSAAIAGKDHGHIYGLGEGWHVRFGLDMSLQFPYGKSLSQVFTKGRSMGFNGAVGKWFSPEIALRGRMNWENGFKLFENKKLEWIASEEGTKNIDKGGYITLAVEVPVSLTNIFMGVDEGRKWDVNIFPRAGLGINLGISSCSPFAGGGAEVVYHLNKRWSLFGEIGYQGITSEFYGEVGKTGMSVSKGFDSFMEVEIGAEITF